MKIRKFAPKTQHDYVQRVKNFAAFLGRSPELATFEDVRRYQLHLTASRIGAETLNQTVSTPRFFFRVTLKRHDIFEHTHLIREPRKLPVVRSPDEVARFLDAASGLKYKAALSAQSGHKHRYWRGQHVPLRRQLLPKANLVHAAEIDCDVPLDDIRAPSEQAASSDDAEDRVPTPTLSGMQRTPSGPDRVMASRVITRRMMRLNPRADGNAPYDLRRSD